jgi:hypothetical protein
MNLNQDKFRLFVDSAKHVDMRKLISLGSFRTHSVTLCGNGKKIRFDVLLYVLGNTRHKLSMFDSLSHGVVDEIPQ